MRATDLLLEDHRDIERLLEIIAGVVRRLRAGKAVDGQALKQVVEVLRGYADEYHHAREEQHVFPILEQYPLLTMAGRLDCMPGEHELGRQVTSALSAAVERYAEGDVAATEEIAESAIKYLQLLGHHMSVEEGVLFELADRVVSDEDDTAMTEALERVTRDQQATGALEHYRVILNDLKYLGQPAVETVS